MHPLLGIVVGLLVAQFGILVTSVYLHRGVTHKALTVHPAVAMFCRVFIWIATGMRPREWAAVHRRHHASTDTADDPHSPAVLGFWRVQLANAALYRRRARDGETVPKYGRDLPADRLDRWFFDHAALGLAIGITLLCVILGWQTGLLAAGVHAVAYLGLSGAVNAVGHTVGRRPYPNSATNGQLLALITSGEGLHNNHHAAPTSARFSLAPGQLDPGWLAVRVLTILRLAQIRHDEVKLKHAA
ncbi:MAG TPA: fatty acid desaturase [Acidimicrobiia bacterium]|nr:fatty acid desaturase [Acidimicrobiia bacterium]